MFGMVQRVDNICCTGRLKRCQPESDFGQNKVTRYGLRVMRTGV